MASFFSAAGFFHRYYFSMLAPGIAALVGIAVTILWRDRRGAARRTETLFRRLVAFHGAILGTALLNRAVFAVAQLALPAPLAAGLGIAAGSLVNFLVQDRCVFTTRGHAARRGERGR